MKSDKMLISQQRVYRSTEVTVNSFNKIMTQSEHVELKVSELEYFRDVFIAVGILMYCNTRVPNLYCTMDCFYTDSDAAERPHCSECN